MKNSSIKPIIITLITIFVALTITLCVMQPKMHKFFQVNVIEYLIKINSDGSVSTTTNTTTTVLQEKK